MSTRLSVDQISDSLANLEKLGWLCRKDNQQIGACSNVTVYMVNENVRWEVAILEENEDDDEKNRGKKSIDRVNKRR